MATRSAGDDVPTADVDVRKQRMSYPPCVCTRQPLRPVAEVTELAPVTKAHSCPRLCDLCELDGLTITPCSGTMLTVSPDDSQEPTAATSKTTHQHHQHHQHHRHHGSRQGCDRLKVPDAQIRHRKSRNSRKDPSLRSQRPKPPSWQDLSRIEPLAFAGVAPPTVPHIQQPTLTPESPVYTQAATATSSVCRCDSATTRSSGADTPDRRAAGGGGGGAMIRSNIKRTRSRVIDSAEIPRADVVLPLSQTKPSEFNLRKTYHDDTVYLLENAQRCRKWLDTLQESDVTPHLDQSASGDRLAGASKEETITCDIEISHDKWDYLGSPYPNSNSTSSSGDKQ